MIKFKEYLLENYSTHLPHLEELILSNGKTGLIDSLQICNDILLELSGEYSNTKLTVKWDGKFALFCGIDPISKKFFVGTKSIFSKNAKLNFSNSDIIKNHYDIPEVADILKIALANLSSLGITNILQGDVLFTKKMIYHDTINNKEFLVFKPNTITYTVEKNSNIGQQISLAKIGIAFHTEYIVSNNSNELKRSYNIDLNNLQLNTKVWLTTAEIRNLSSEISLTNLEINNIKNILTKIEKTGKLLNKFFLEMPKYYSFIGYIQSFFNQLVRQQKEFTFNNYEEMKNFVMEKYKSSIMRNSVTSFFKDYKQELKKIFEIYNDLIKVKLLFLKKINKMNMLIALNPTKNGYDVSPHEGFIAINSKNKTIVKLVDRLDFSYNNFLNHEK